MLTEDEPIHAYQRKHKQQYFENTPSSKHAKTKSHSPNFDRVRWDKDKVLADLQQCSPAPPSINWQQFAREHGVPGRNSGQVVKEFAKTSGINTEMLDEIRKQLLAKHEHYMRLNTDDEIKIVIIINNNRWHLSTSCPS